MKRKIAICLAMLMLWMPYSAGKAMPEVSSHSACVIDIDTGRILAAKNENEKSEPASITKIMTALIALENGIILPEDSTRTWSGERFWNEDWNKDIDFREAFRTSCVWYFRQVIDDIGKDRMQKELEKQLRNYLRRKEQKWL